MAQDDIEMLARGIAQIVQQQRCACSGLLDLRPLVVENAQRVDLCPLARGLIQVEAEQELLQRLPIAGPGLVVAERGDLQPESRQTQPPIPLVGDRDPLGIERRIVHADGLHPDLLQLAIATLLRLLVAEERPGVAELDRELSPVQTVLDHRPHHPGRTLGPQRHRPPPTVGEGVHLLADHVSGFTDPPREQAGVLEDRQLDVAVAGAARGVGQRVADTAEIRRRGWKIIRDAPWCLEFGAHSPNRPFFSVPIPSRNGLVARSAPIEVCGP